MLPRTRIGLTSALRSFSTAKTVWEIDSRPLFGSAAKKILFDLPAKPAVISSSDGVHAGVPGKLSLMRRCVSALVSKERIELPYKIANEARAYTERLIQLSVKASFEDPRTHSEIIDTIKVALEAEKKAEGSGVVETDKNTAILETTMFWLQSDFKLMQRLFMVLVPRYRHYNRPYTDIYKLTYPYLSHQEVHQYSLDREFGVLELHGNPWPKVGSPGLRFNQEGQMTKHPYQKDYLINVLLDAAKAKSKKN